eukprot:7294806-Pyramimonas_sp.AAC.1
MGRLLGPSWRPSIKGGGVLDLPPLRGHQNRLLGPSWGALGRSWGCLGGLLGPSWSFLGPSWGHVEASKAHRKRNGEKANIIDSV